MRLKSVVKYNISELKKSVLIFYGIIAAVLVLTAVSMGVFVVKSGGEVNFVGGTEMASAIFLFVVGLNSFKQNYLFLSTNGITRKAQFYGFLIGSLTIVTVMGAVDTVYGNILSEFMTYNSLFSQIYKGLIITSKPFIILIGFLWSLALYLFTVVLGYFITTLYYRMSKLLKVIVSVGVPALFTMILPVIDEVVTNGKIFGCLGELFNSLSGLKNGYNPFVAVVSLLIGSAILAGLAYLLVRKAPVKE